jgi:phosphoribosyl 1,2-cyclic phosphodiesterase
MSNPFEITFWGVRGTMPTPGPDTLKYGGHTSCVEMRCGERRLIFDAGSGIAGLGRDASLQDVDLFLSHTHIDHIMGFPFFGPVFREGVKLRLWTGHLMLQRMNLKEVMRRLISPPIFPLRLEDLKAHISYYDFVAGNAIDAEHLDAAGSAIKTMPLNHPDGATGYRVEYEGRSACYITDVEHLRDGLDATLIEFISGTDLLIYDCTFDDRDFDRFVGWGHSTWQEATRLADAANVKKLALFHHDPARSDADLDARLIELHAIRPNDVVAREGMVISLHKT